MLNNLFLATTIFLSSTVGAFSMEMSNTGNNHMLESNEIQPRGAISKQIRKTGKAKMYTPANYLQDINYDVTVYLSWDNQTGKIYRGDFLSQTCTVPATGQIFKCRLTSVKFSKTTYTGKFMYRPHYLTLQGMQMNEGPDFTVSVSPGVQ